MKRFEYLVMHVDGGIGADAKRLNELGAEGWDMVAAITPIAAPFFQFIFKRRLDDPHVYERAMRRRMSGD